AALFEWGVALHDLDFEAIRKGEKSKAQLQREVRGILGKARQQIVKDYVAWPLISALAAGGVRAAIEAGRRPGLRERVGRRLRRRPGPFEVARSSAVQTF